MCPRQLANSEKTYILVILCVSGSGHEHRSARSDAWGQLSAANLC